MIQIQGEEKEGRIKVAIELEFKERKERDQGNNRSSKVPRHEKEGLGGNQIYV